MMAAATSAIALPIVSTVRRLELDGLVSRTVKSTFPPAVTYELSARGQSFAILISGLVYWSGRTRNRLRSQRAFDQLQDL